MKLIIAVNSFLIILVERSMCSYLLAMLYLPNLNVSKKKNFVERS